MEKLVCSFPQQLLVFLLNKNPFLFLRELSREMLFYVLAFAMMMYVPFTNLSLGFCSVYKLGAIFLS